MVRKEMFDKNHQAFFVLLRAGLWEQEVRAEAFPEATPVVSPAAFPEDGAADYKAVSRLAEEQAVTGLVVAGLERIADGPARKAEAGKLATAGLIPKAEALAMAAKTLQQEQTNGAMNRFIGTLTERLHAAGIAFVLVKGQGVAQCYARPLWRACGDIDLLLDAENYRKAKALLAPLAQKVEPENMDVLHQGLVLDGWLVELHGTLRSRTLPRMDRVIDQIQRDVLEGGDVRVWQNGAVDVPLPGADSDVVLIFTHLFKHFANGGIGLRQVCDWCRLLWTYRGTLDVALLESWLRQAGVLTEWCAFAALAVEYLGMPAEALPLYSPEARWRRKADHVLSRILTVGNFGHNRDMSYYKYPRLIRKMFSLWRHTQDSVQLFAISPRNAVTMWWSLVVQGVAGVAKGE